MNSLKEDRPNTPLLKKQDFSKGKIYSILTAISLVSTFLFWFSGGLSNSEMLRFGLYPSFVVFLISMLSLLVEIRKYLENFIMMETLASNIRNIRVVTCIILLLIFLVFISYNKNIYILPIFFGCLIYYVMLGNILTNIFYTVDVFMPKAKTFVDQAYSGIGKLFFPVNAYLMFDEAEKYSEQYGYAENEFKNNV